MMAALRVVFCGILAKEYVMKAIPISVQLYSVREEAAKDFPGTLKKIARMGYAGVEPAGLHGMPAKRLRTILDDLGLVASSAHRK